MPNINDITQETKDQASELAEKQLVTYYANQVDLVLANEDGVGREFSEMLREHLDNMENELNDAQKFQEYKANILVMVNGAKANGLNFISKNGKKIEITPLPHCKASINGNNISYKDEQNRESEIISITMLGAEINDDQAAILKDNESGYKILVANGRAYAYDLKSFLGKGENGLVYRVTDLESRKDFILKMQSDLNTALPEHAVASKYQPKSLNAPVGVGIARVTNNPELEHITDVYGKTVNLEYFSIQRVAPGKFLGKIEDLVKDYRDSEDRTKKAKALMRKAIGNPVLISDLITVDKPTEQNVYEKLRLAQAIIEALKLFHEQTHHYYVDLRPENIFYSDYSGVTLIDFGAARKFDEHKIANGRYGQTPGFTHPDITPESGEDVQCAYGEVHEAYALRQVMRFMGIEALIKKLDHKSKEKFQLITGMFNLKNEDLTIEKIEKSIKTTFENQLEQTTPAPISDILKGQRQGGFVAAQKKAIEERQKQAAQERDRVKALENKYKASKDTSAQTSLKKPTA